MRQLSVANLLTLDIGSGKLLLNLFDNVPLSPR